MASSNLPFEYIERWKDLVPDLTGKDPAAKQDAENSLERRDRDLEDFLSKPAGAALLPNVYTASMSGGTPLEGNDIVDSPVVTIPPDDSDYIAWFSATYETAGAGYGGVGFFDALLYQIHGSSSVLDQTSWAFNTTALASAPATILINLNGHGTFTQDGSTTEVLLEHNATSMPTGTIIVRSKVTVMQCVLA